MSNRERWVVYPLLFFALGLGLKNQFVIPDDPYFNAIRCKRLTIESDSGNTLVHLGELHPGVGAIQLAATIDAGADAPADTGDAAAENSAQGSTADASQPEPDDKLTQVMRPRRVAELTANSSGGLLRLFGPKEMPALQIGHDRAHRRSGLVGADAVGNTVEYADAGPNAATIPGVQILWDAVSTVDTPAAAAPNGEQDPAAASESPEDDAPSETATEDDPSARDPSEAGDSAGNSPENSAENN